MSEKRRVSVAGQDIWVPERTTERELRGLIGLPDLDGTRALAVYRPSTGQSQVLPPSAPITVEGGERFEDVPDCEYGAAREMA